jgi:hypothetical protein
MMKSNLLLSNAGFLDRFMELHTSKPKRPFCWILGTGASASSGIPMGRDLTQKWLTEMYERVTSPKSSLKEWVNQEFQSVPGFTYETATNFYPYIYQCRYQKNPEQGIAFLEAMLEAAKPSFGYKVLAQIMASTIHKVAVTTNFDNLISTSITLYTEKEPFVCGSESLADFVIATLRRPLVAKIHREFLLASLNDPDEIIHLDTDWEQPLTELFRQYTPIIVGFGDLGGSGGSLMRFLQQLPPLKSGMFWCYRERTEDALPAKEIQSIVKHHNGQLIPILGFDELMFELSDVLKMTLPQNELADKHSKLVNEYGEAFFHIAKHLISLQSVGNSATLTTAIKCAKAALARLDEDSFL